MIDFGLMPIANGFLRPSDLGAEVRYPLSVVACPACAMVQLVDVVPPEILFPAEYAFHSSTSDGMARHFQRLATDVIARHSGSVPFVVELGSNDGILLQHVAKAGIRHLGVEPAANVAAEARAKGVNTVSRFFGVEVARDIREQYGPASAMIAANVLCHLPDIHDVIDGVDVLLSPDGVFITEDPYLGDILEKTSFDQIYDEHIFYFSLTSMEALFAPHGFCVVDVEAQPVHGGSMRYVMARTGARAPGARVLELRHRESTMQLKAAATYADFRARVETTCAALRDLLVRLKDEGRRVVGYGATSKSTTTLVHCGITADLVEYISDTTPGKQGRLSPGAHIPIVPPSVFAAAYPDDAILFAWNHAAEVMDKEGEFLRRGGRFLTYVPDVRFISAPT